jgi:hypothetical protein
VGRAVEDTDPVSISMEVDVDSLRTNEEVVLSGVGKTDSWSEARSVELVDENSAMDEDEPASSVDVSAKWLPVRIALYVALE